ILALACGSSALATNLDELKRSVTDRESAVQAKKKEMARLTAEERKKYKDLAKFEDKVRDLESRVQEHEQALSAIEARESEAKAEYEWLGKELGQKSEELSRLMAWLWPAYFKSLESQMRNMSDWAEMDRMFSWLSFFYGRTRETMRVVRRMAEETAEGLKRLEALKSEAEAALEGVNQLKNETLKDRLVLVQEVQKLRAVKLEREEEVNSLLESIRDLNYKIRILSTKQIVNLKGFLPWPAKGKVVKKFDPGASPPSKGLGMALEQGQEVRAVCWGQVVHVGQLRGFGQVVVLFHGDQYYSLYAFLAEASVQSGAKVEKGEVVGVCGPYPEARGPGLYFELRYGQKAVNPLQWFAEK
ncbi:MAG: hypothetical protein EOM25_11645, partial [Deltaproteobacteria bacterium]|nr:hypothetical protein [Deltaproteobacteria bacterium]